MSEKKISKKSKYTFQLIVNIEKTDQKFGIGIASIDINAGNIPKNSTKLDDIENIGKIPEIVSFLDESKKLRKCCVSMINFNTRKSLVEGRYKCYWDKDYIPLGIQPIGCPIKYVPHKAVKTYLSEISKDQYTITENVTDKKALEIKERKDPRIVIEENGYYETDGIFCSFNCVLAYLLSDENRLNPMYKNSFLLLNRMYSEIVHGKQDSAERKVEMIPAPSWRLLKDFGGTLNIEQFRENFNRVEYIYHGIIACSSIGRIYEDKLKF